MLDEALLRLERISAGALTRTKAEGSRRRRPGFGGGGAGVQGAFASNALCSATSTYVDLYSVLIVDETFAVIKFN
ncbi:hypothetical protein SOASR032_00230 [Pragia fontium]|uniref:Uncharacterized protein n=1 Tax=Pragia fontium TaxID=82985 RepID=A0ABQ5LDK4_9GAMM|nr:hypothetical protein SOASR032_00230 [Pragia fontium]